MVMMMMLMTMRGSGAMAYGLEFRPVRKDDDEGDCSCAAADDGQEHC